MYRILKEYDVDLKCDVYIVQRKETIFYFWTRWKTMMKTAYTRRSFFKLSEAENYVKSKMEGPKVVRTYEIPPKEC